MKVLELHNKNLDYKQFIKRSAREEDCEVLLTEPVIGVEGNEIKFVYDFLPDSVNTSALVEAFKTIKYTKGKRARGLYSQSRIFGYKPRLEMRGDFCSSTSLSNEFPKENAVVCSFAGEIEKIYKDKSPEAYEKHRGEVHEKVLDSYRMTKDSVFTS